MAAISRAQLLKELLPGLNALFGLSYKSYDEQHKAIYEIENSDRSFEEEVKLSGFGSAPVKAEGAAMVYDSAQESYIARFTHETIVLGFSLTEEAVEDNLYDSLSARYTKALARAMAYTKQVKAAAVLNSGFTAVGGDGVALFSASHPLVGGGLNSNLGTAADLSETTLEAAVIQINQWTDERGLLIVAKPKKLVIPPQLQFVATRLLETSLRTSASAINTFAPNDINALKNNGIFPGGYVVNNYLTDVNGYFICTDVPNGMKMFVRVPMKTGMDADFDTGNARYKARERYSFGVSDFLGVWGSAGS
jgi:hypothetical protein